MSTRQTSAKAIFLQALELITATEREAYLDTQCGSDADLRREVEELLRHNGDVGSFLESPPTAVVESAEQLRTIAPQTPSLGFLTPSSRADSLGRLAHHEVLEVVGSGGMGIVLKAFDERLQRVVAIKVMAAPLAASAASRKRFQREARAAAAVCHDHIVTIHAVEESGDLPYLVMQYISGLSLQERIDRDGPLELHEILRIGMQTAAGLAAAHAQGLIHRDIKPANILLENGVERVKITDFGLARAAADASISQSGAVIGTPQYMAPEQARGEALDGRTDLFSLGSVLYAMCTGRAPFRATSSIAVLKRVCEEAPSPIREANADIPDWLVALIDKLHAKNPDDRYQSAAEVAEVLGQRLAQLQNSTALPPAVLLASGGRKPPDSSVPAGGSRSLARKRRWAFAAAAVLVLAATFGLAEGTGATKFTATVIRLLTPEGTLVVEMTDPDVKVTIDGDGGLVITGVGQHVVHLKLGSHTLQADKDGQPVPLEKELVSIRQGGREVVKVKLEAPPALASKDAPPSAVAPFDAATAKEHQEAWAKHLGLPVEFTNSIGMKFRLIPPGEFEMGSTPQDIEAARAAEKYSDDQAVSDALTSEGPIHRAVLSEPFYLGVTEVTQKDFETVTGENPSSFRPGGEDAEKVRDIDTAQLPVQGTSWNDAANFCSRLSLREGLISNYRPVGSAVEMLPGNGYRLPREAQWEFACRGGTTTRFWFGDKVADHTNREWFRANSAGRLQRVGSLAKNPFGLFDMHGNVSEWCQDGWNPEFYLMSKDRPAVDPLSKPKGPHQHMVRGGAWTSQPAVRGRSAFRMPAVPSKQYEASGLRVTLSVDSARQVIERSAHGAFVVLDGQGIEVRKFDTLAEAVQSASDGDTIEIRGNGPFASKPISIGRTALTIRAGAGCRPVIKPSSDGIEKAPFLATDGALVLEGLDFQAMFPEDQKNPGGSIHGSNASLRAANCRFHGGIWMAQSPVCVFRNCEFLIGHGGWSCYGQQISSGARILFENCLSSSNGHAIHLFYAIDATDDVSIQITRCTFTSKSAPLALSLQCPTPAGMDGPKASKPIRLEVSRSVFDSSGIFAFGQQQGFTDKVGVLPPAEADAMLLRLLDWRGEWNLFPAGSNSVYWYANFKAQPPRGPKGLDEWKKFSGSKEADSRDGQPRFHGGNLLARAELDQLSPDDFRLRADSAGYRAGKDGQDLGADVDLVGPGPPYERWKKMPEYQQWLKETKQVKQAETLKAEPKAFVLLGGKDVAERKFDTLAEALLPASNGDIIEVHGNGPFVTPPVSLGNRALTLRAASGFHPVIRLNREGTSADAPLLTTNSSLVLEGLELGLTDEVSHTGYPARVMAGGPSVSAVNCRFHWPPYGHFSITSRIGRFRNCEFVTGASGVFWQYPNDGELAFDNCVQAGGGLVFFSYRPLTKETPQVHVAHCTVRALTVVTLLVQPGTMPVKAEAGGLFRLAVSESVIDVNHALQIQTNHDERAQLGQLAERIDSVLPNLLSWRDRQNLYAEDNFDSFVTVYATEPIRPPSLWTLADWDKTWDQSKAESFRGRVRYHGGDPLAGQVTPEGFRLRPDSPGYRTGKDGKDLGADVELVGPGPAYERWKKTPEYQQWLQELEKVE